VAWVVLEGAFQEYGMVTRRQFLQRTASGLVTSPILLGCSGNNMANSYEELVSTTWRHSEPPSHDTSAMMRDLVRYATLAPSSHNTQCWKFSIGTDEISILPDLTRRCPVVDPDDHHLYASLGCAAENLAHAALANGYDAVPVPDGDAGAGIRLALTRTSARATPLFDAIPRRQCTRADYDATPIANEELRLLERAGSGNGVRALLLTDRDAMENVLEYVIQANTVQMHDPAFVSELKHWIRFSDQEAIEQGDGLFGRSSGNPAIPRWLGSPLFNMVFTVKSENDKCARQIRSSSGIAVFVSDANDKRHWIETGRCYERFALQATALGIRNAMLSQPVEVAALRPQFADFLDVSGKRPDLIVRFGRGPEMPRSLRRPLQAVIV
jgi:hypothetical protein